MKTSAASTGWAGRFFERRAPTRPRDERSLDNAVRALRTLGITHLLCIGGDDTTFGAARIAERAAGSIHVATVPKTIDNDLPLARQHADVWFRNGPRGGNEHCRKLDGRCAHHHTLVPRHHDGQKIRRAGSRHRQSGWRDAGGDTRRVPAGTVPLSIVTDTIVGSIIKRRVSEHNHGVAVIAEGLAERLDPKELGSLESAGRDAYGNVRLTDVDLGDLLKRSLTAALKALALDVTIVAKDIGYELRCAKPVAFDVEYARTLGYGAVRYLLSGGSGAMVALRGGKVTPVTLQEMLDPATGRVRVRWLTHRPRPTKLVAST